MRGPVKRRPSRRTAGANRLSLPEEPSGYLPGPTGPQAGPSAGSPVKPPAELSVESPEESPSSAARPAVRKPPAGARQLPGLLSAELRGRLARRAGSEEAATDLGADRTGGSSVSPVASRAPKVESDGKDVPEAPAIREIADGRATLADVPKSPSTTKRNDAPATPSDIPDKATDTIKPPTSVPDTPAAPGRTSPGDFGQSVVPEAPVSASSAPAAGVQSVTKAAHSLSGSARPPVPARPVGRPADPSPTPPAASIAQTAPAAATASPAASTAPAVAPAVSSVASTNPVASATPAAAIGASEAPIARAAASLFDSDSDEDLFHMPAPRPAAAAAAARTDVAASGAKPAPSAVEPSKKAVSRQLPVETEPGSVTVASDGGSGGVEVHGDVNKDNQTDGGRSSSVEAANDTEAAISGANPAAHMRNPISRESDHSPTGKARSGTGRPKLEPKPTLAPTQSSVLSPPPPEERSPPETTAAPPPLPPSAALFGGSDEEDLFQPAAVRPTAGVSGPAAAASATSSGAPVKSDDGKLWVGGSGAGTEAVTAGSGEAKNSGGAVVGPDRSEGEGGTSDDVVPGAHNTGGESNEHATPNVTPTVPASSVVTKARAVPDAVTKPSHNVFDSDSDEDLFQTIKPKPASKDASEGTLKATSVGENATFSTLSGGHHDRDSSVSKNENITKGEDDDYKDVGPWKTKHGENVHDGASLPSEEGTVASAAPAVSTAPASAAITPAAPTQPVISNQDPFDSDSDEYLFQTAMAKPKSTPTAVSAEGPKICVTADTAPPATAKSISIFPKPPSLEDKAADSSDQLSGSSLTVDGATRQPPVVPEDGLDEAANAGSAMPASGTSPTEDRAAEDVWVVNEEFGRDVAMADDATSAGLEEAESEGSGPEGLPPDQEKVEAQSEEVTPTVAAGGTQSGTPAASEAPDAVVTPPQPAVPPVHASPDVSSSPVTADITVTPASTAAELSPAATAVTATPAATATTKPSRSLFDSDSDEEDLFQTMKPKSAVKTPTANLENPSLREAVSSNITKEPVKEPNSEPKGKSAEETSSGVDVDRQQASGERSTLGVTPLAAKDRAETARTTGTPAAPKSPVPHTAPVAVAAANKPDQSAKANRSLFDSDSDEDDLFQSVQKPKPASAASQPIFNESNAKKHTSSQVPSMGSAGSASVSVSAARKTEPAGRRNDNLNAGVNKPRKQSANIGEIKPASQHPDAPSKNVLLPRTQRKDAKPSRSLFSSDSDDEDLFSTAKNRPTTAPTALSAKLSAQRPKSAANTPAAATSRSVKPAANRSPSAAATPASVPARSPVSLRTSAPAPAPAPAAAPAPAPARVAVSARHAAPTPPLQDSDDEDLFGSAKNAPRPAGRSASDWEKAASAASQIRSSAVPANAAVSAKTPAAARTIGSVKAPASTKTASVASKTTGRAAPASLFSDDDDDGDLFGTAKTAPTARVPARTGGGLFSVSDEEEGTPQPAAQKAEEAATAGSGKRRPARVKAKTGE